MISKTSSVTPHFFAFLAKADHYLSAWQVLKKSVRGNVKDVRANCLCATLLRRQPDCNMSRIISSSICEVEIFKPLQKPWTISLAQRWIREDRDQSN